MFSEKFISATKERNTLAKNIAAPYMRKTVVFDTLPDSIEITVCGLGFYDMEIALLLFFRKAHIIAYCPQPPNRQYKSYHSPVVRYLYRKETGVW